MAIQIKKLAISLLVGGLVWELICASTVQANRSPRTVLVSISRQGIQGNRISYFPQISSNGRFVVFASYADNLDGADTTGFYSDIFVRDLLRGEIKRVSVNSKGQQASYDYFLDSTFAPCPDEDNFFVCGSFNPDISASGRYVVFQSSATNLLEDDEDFEWSRVYIRDLRTGLTKLVSIANNDLPHDGEGPAISSDGRFVVFWSAGPNLTPDCDRDNVYVRDVKTGVTKCISQLREKEWPANQRYSVGEFSGESSPVGGGIKSISGNGRFVSYTLISEYYSSTNPYPWNSPEITLSDIIVYDLKTRKSKNITRSRREDGNSYNNSPSLSADGRFVAFQSLNSKLVAGDNNGKDDVFVRDLRTGMTKRVSISSSGIEGNQGSGSPSLSADGRFVTFTSLANNLVAGGTDDAGGVFVHDIKTGVTKRVSLNNHGQPGNGYSFSPDISGNGKFVVFESGACNLVDNDTNCNSSDYYLYGPQTWGDDIFVRRR